MLASVFLADVDNQTLGVGLYGMTLGNEANRLFGRFTAGALLASIPRSCCSTWPSRSSSSAASPRDP